MFGIKTKLLRKYDKKIQGFKNRHVGLFPKRCSCCENRFRRYLPLTDHFREQKEKYGCNTKSTPEMVNEIEYACPICGASDRERAYAIFMKKEIDPTGELQILDIAPSKPLSDFIQKGFPKAIYKTGDLFMEGVDYKLDIMNMYQIRDDSVDFFICSHVLEHVRDDMAAMRELKRILKKNGRGICVVPIDLSRKEIDEDPDCTDVGERWRRFGQDDHVRAYSKEGYIERLKTAGFGVMEYNTDHFSKLEVEENGLLETSVVYIVKK